MSEPKTPEQQQAHEDLEQAIRKAVTAEGWDGLVTDAIVICAVQGFDDEGESVTHIARLIPGGGEIPSYRAMGLLDYALAGFRNDIRDEASLEGGDDA